MEAVFDHSAAAYDREFTHSNTGKMQRNRVWSYLSGVLPNQHALQILELNCGTGEDALFFAERGHSVIATDLSSEMVKLAEAKGNGHEAKDRLSYRTLSMEHAHEVYAGRQFDLLFSNFGGMNCLSPKALKHFMEKVDSLLTPQGRLIAVIMPRFCLQECCYFLLKGNRKSAFRRRSKKAVKANVNGQQQSTWYYSPADIRRLLPAGLEVAAIRPVGFFASPSYLEPFLQNKRILLKIMESLEQATGNWSMLSPFSDHFLIDIRKVS